MMISNIRHRRAFTLIEVLIVVVIMAVLAATVIPQFSSSTTDAKKSGLKFNMHFIRSQIELYKDQHNGTFPAFSSFVQQMTQATDVSGSTTVNSANPIYGPYIQGQFPNNDFTNTNTVVAVATPGTVPTGVVDNSSGWQYDELTGGFYPNNAEAFQPGF